MKLKLVLLVLAVLLLAWLMLQSGNFLQQAGMALSQISADWWGFIALAIAVQLFGHWLRTLRTKTVIDQVKEGSAFNQFGALAVGYLFNSLLPLKLGELIRAGAISETLRISFSYTFTAIAIERAIDLLLISILVIGFSAFSNGQVAFQLLVGAVGAIMLALAIIAIVTLLVREDKRLLSGIWHISNLFNVHVRNQIRFKAWALIFGLQRFVAKKQAVRRYALLTIASWGCYIVSMSLLVMVVLQNVSVFQALVSAVSPYIAAAVPTGSGYSSSFEHIVQTAISTSGTIAQVPLYVILSWTMLTVPMLVLGFIALLFLKAKITKRSKLPGNESFANKLLRQEDISQEFPVFLDSYFSGNTLAQVLHKIELSGELSLVKFFKGGSDAITILVLSKNELFVKKIIPLEYEDRLKAQYNWLKKHQGLKPLVRVLDEQRGDNYYAIDLAYNPENVPFFEYIHHNSFKQSVAVLEKTWRDLHSHLYEKTKELKYRPKQRDKFIEKHLLGCVDKAVAQSDALRDALASEKIVINGEEYDNFYQILEKIKQHPQAWRDIATYRESQAVHGDMAIDNVLVSPATGKPLIIDPAPDGNIINGPVFDLGKIMQSFYCGYEFLFRDDDAVDFSEAGKINYRDHRSERYTRLCRYVQKELAPQYLEEPEQKALLFHAAALHIRVLKHRVYINPANVLKFYAVGVKTLNEFLAQYE